jgi:hypothetical protein
MLWEKNGQILVDGKDGELKVYFFLVISNILYGIMSKITLLVANQQPAYKIFRHLNVCLIKVKMDIKLEKQSK